MCNVQKDLTGSDRSADFAFYDQPVLPWLSSSKVPHQPAPTEAVKEQLIRDFIFLIRQEIFH